VYSTDVAAPTSCRASLSSKEAGHPVLSLLEMLQFASIMGGVRGGQEEKNKDNERKGSPLWINLKADDPGARILLRLVVVEDDNRKVVVQVSLLVLLKRGVKLAHINRDRTRMPPTSASQVPNLNPCSYCLSPVSLVLYGVAPGRFSMILLGKQRFFG